MSTELEALVARAAVRGVEAFLAKVAAGNGVLPPRKLWLDENETAAYLGVHRSSLFSWRKNNMGPPSHRMPVVPTGSGKGRVRYHVDELDAWLASRSSGAGES